jgi:hypothetical protein
MEPKNTEHIDIQLIEDSVLYVDDVPKLKGTIIALIRYIRNLKMPEIKNRHLYDYIGDGVYVKWRGDGVWLLANDHENPTDKVFLEMPVLDALNRFVKRMAKAT